MSGLVIWFTGLPASGKTTLARAVRSELVGAGIPTALLDSDELRASLSPAPGYDPAGRADFYRTLANLAAMLADQGLVVLVAATANRRAFRDAARSAAPAFLEVYLDTPLEVCMARDPKGLYRAAGAGDVSSLPGVGSEYEAPASPDLVVRGAGDTQAVARIVARTRAVIGHTS